MKSGLIYLAALVGLFFSNPAVQDHPAGIARPIVRAAHRYHGIQVSHEDATGFYFYRGGQRCLLFTEGFLKRREVGIWRE